MPLLVLTAREAFDRALLENARWPGRTAAQRGRLQPVTTPALKPSFRFGKHDLIFTIGSCFARNIEKQLMIEGYDVAFSRFRPPPDPAIQGDPDLMLHRYVPQAIANELAWALSDEDPFPEALCYQEPGGGWRDLQLNLTAAAAPLETVRERRRALGDYMRLAAEARVFIMTVGLAEAWFDRQTGLYLNAAPPQSARKLFPERFEFHLLGPEEIVAGLERIHELLRRHGRADLKILATVSPVALSTTFTGEDVLVANSYMKSALRAAVEVFARGHEGVDYFPSYESVVLSDRRRAWREDQAHVSDELVRLNVLRMLGAYSEEAAEVAPRLAALAANDHVHAAREAVAWGRKDKARESYLAAAAAAPEDGLILLEAGRFLIGEKRWDEALPLVEASLRHGSELYGGWHGLARILQQRRRFRQAWSAALQAQRFEPNSAPVVGLAADLAVKLGLRDEAHALTERLRQLEPGSASSQRRLDRLARGGLFGRRGGAGPSAVDAIPEPAAPGR